MRLKAAILLIVTGAAAFSPNAVFSLAGETQTSRRQNLANPHSLLYLPLDERFVTRDFFLATAKITDFKILTPEKSMLSHQKNPPEMKALLEWTEEAAKNSGIGIISADMFLYGGLIASRISRDSADAVRARLKILEKIHREHPQFRMFVSTTVMRIPAYPSAEEEPDYYADYGREIFLYSFHAHRYGTLHDRHDEILADQYKSRIPPPLLDDFLARRKRNFSVNRELIKLVEKNVIERLVITLDDNAEYGFSKKEAVELEKLAAPWKNRIAVYPGADEAQLALLSNVVGVKRVSVYPVYRFPHSKKLVPAFEGAPLDESVRRQIRAAGGILANDWKKAECILYVNNFEERETFPPKNQPDLPADIELLETWLKETGVNSNGGKILILADNRFYNGADAELIAAVLQTKINRARIAYAGWNTSGNTLGSSLALGFLRARMAKKASNFLNYKKLLFTRFIEDWAYMTVGRDTVRNEMARRNLKQLLGTEFEQVAALEMENLFNARAVPINRFLKTDFNVRRVFFPWHRPFEIGFEVFRRHREKNSKSDAPKSNK